MTLDPVYLRYWAKTLPEDPRVYHPVAYHCLDVAAVGRVLLEVRPGALQQLAHVAGLPVEIVRDLVTVLLSVHDLGKLADGFQGLVPSLMENLQGGAREANYGGSVWRHDTVGYVVLRQRLRIDGLAGLLTTGTPEGARRCFSKSWLSAAMGHHGVPPTLDLQSHRAGIARQFPPEVEADLETTIAELRKVLFPGVLSIQGDDVQQHRFAAASWLFAGLAVAADWIGSNAQWFPPSIEPRELATYYQEVALPQAREAVSVAGLEERLGASAASFGELWPGFAPTPLQQLADKMPLASGAQLIVVEEVTGGGKTEAAFTLAHRLIAGGSARGLYIGLPTMATANAMYDRLEQAYRRLYAEESEPSLVLAHGRSHLRHYLRLEAAGGEKDAYSSDHDTATARCSAWLGDSRKKALLADVGIGTIDQALLGVLHARHQSLRLWGLAGKVLIVDEVHAADAYMQRLLATLLEAHAAYGGSAILLSATLSSRQRRKLCEAFARGADADFETPTDRSYPAVLYLSRERTGINALEARKTASRELRVDLLRDAEAVDAQIRTTLDNGGCACWIRNTVQDAIGAWEDWSERLGTSRCTLFHARFSVEDRQAIEDRVLKRFGDRSGPEERAGKLVIATQVVEQSLDLDFDTLVSDLAPIDLLIQRAGRLRRHRRDLRGTRIEGSDRRGPPTLHVYTPYPDEDCSADWFESFLPGAARVYPHHGVLWLGARWLADHRRLRVPEDLREVIEHVYGEGQGEIPKGLEEVSSRAEGASQADASAAKLNRLCFRNGYRPERVTSSWRDDVGTPTRLGEPTVTLRLARLVDGELAPWHAGGAYAWERSQLSVRQYLVAEEWEGDAKLVESARARMRDQGRYVLIVVLREGADGRATGRAMDERGRMRLVTYDPSRGLTIEDSPAETGND